MVVGRGQSTRSHPTNGESHALSEEIRKIDDIGDGKVSASSPGETYSFIEVKNVLAPAEAVELSNDGRCIFQLSDDGSDFGDIRGLGGDSEDSAQEEGR